jgi:hypothetical protein
MTLGYFHVMAEPVSTWVHEILRAPAAADAALGDEVVDAAHPFSSPGYQFCTVEYLISAPSRATSSTTAACSWFSSRMGAVQPSR